MKALLGRKVGMTQQFNDQGESVPVTLVQAGPCFVTQVRTTDKDGYNALQLGLQTAKKVKKPQAGHLRASKARASVLREVRLPETDGQDEQPAYSVGDRLDVSVFEPGDRVMVSGTSKGKGFAGTVKRHNFSRGPLTHGSHSQRRPGSIGSMYPQKIFRGKKMAGRMGNETVTTKNLTIAEVLPEDNLLAIKGAIPGPNKGTVFIKEV